MSVLEFFIESVRKEEIHGKRVIEVGSRYVNGSVRPLIENFLSPSLYVGVDIESGKYVDKIVPAENLVDTFGPESFDIVISTELLEHVVNWRRVIENLKDILKRGGYIYITTRSRGYPYHAYPYDFWRYEVEDMMKIFGDFEIIKLAKDYEAPGIFLKARKPFEWKPIDLSAISLYSMVLGRRTDLIPNLSDMPVSRRLVSVLQDKGRTLLSILVRGLYMR